MLTDLVEVQIAVDVGSHVVDLAGVFHVRRKGGQLAEHGSEFHGCLVLSMHFGYQLLPQHFVLPGVGSISFGLYAIRLAVGQ